MRLKEKDPQETARPETVEKAVIDEIVPVLLAGGLGRRLWPLSRPDHPKPFLKLKEGTSYYQKTLKRVSALAAPVVICGSAHYELAQKQAAEVKTDPCHIFVEPQPRNTGAAIGVVAHYYKASRKEDQVLLILPTDHDISFTDRFMSRVAQALPLARQDKVVLFGVRPTSSDKGYGYIRAGRKQEDNLYKVSRFVEKPAKEKIAQYMKKDGWLWNSGIIMARAGQLVHLMEKNNPALSQASYEAVARAARRQEVIILDESRFAACPADSFDHAVLEKARGLNVIAADMGWEDIGTWPRLIRNLFSVFRR